MQYCNLTFKSNVLQHIIFKLKSTNFLKACLVCLHPPWHKAYLLFPKDHHYESLFVFRSSAVRALLARCVNVCMTHTTHSP